MRRFFSCVCAILFACLCAFADEREYKKVTVEIPYHGTTLYSTFFCFDDLQTGRQLAKELYGIEDLDKILRSGRFKRLMAVPPGSEISAYNFSIMTYGREFWFFENRDDGWLWGTGRY